MVGETDTDTDTDRLPGNMYNFYILSLGSTGVFQIWYYTEI